MKSLRFGRNSLVALCACAAVMTSCGEEPPEPEDQPFEAYYVSNQSSANIISFAKYEEKFESFLSSGQYSSTHLVGDERYEGRKWPDAVASVISLSDSAIEIVPRLAARDSCYNLFSGLEDWYTTEEGDWYVAFSVDITDEVLSSIASRMRSKGLPPYRTTKEVIVNRGQMDVKITTRRDGIELGTVVVAKGDSVTMPVDGMVMHSDEYTIEASGKSYTEKRGMALDNLEGRPHRIGKSEDGYRKYVLTDHWFEIRVGEL